MRAVIQRVLGASVSIGGNPVSQTDKGLLVLIGIAPGDNAGTVDYMLDKILHLRVFADEQGKMNLSLLDIGGELMIVPNFTLYGDARKSRRPSYSAGASPQDAALIFEQIKQAAAEKYPAERLGFGVFQAEMLVNIQNDGPVTILLDSDRAF